MNCTAIEVSEDQTRLIVQWYNIHTGGLNLTSATIEYTLLFNGTNASFTEAQNASINLQQSTADLQFLPDAGLEYIFRVITENEVGESVPSECPPIFLDIGQCMYYKYCTIDLKLSCPNLHKKYPYDYLWVLINVVVRSCIALYFLGYFLWLNFTTLLKVSQKCRL